MLCMPQGPWWPKILEAKYNTKDTKYIKYINTNYNTKYIKLLAAKKTTYIDVNTRSTNEI